MKDFERLMISVKAELKRYEAEYTKEFDSAEVEAQHKEVIAEAATGYVEGIMMAVIYGFGVEAKDEFLNMVDDLNCECIKGQTVTGIALA